MSTEPVRVLATFHPAADTEHSVLDILREVARHTRREAGNHQFDIHRSETDGLVRFQLIERFQDAAAIEAHCATAHYRDYRERIKRLLTAPIDVAILQEGDTAPPPPSDTTGTPRAPARGQHP